MSCEPKPMRELQIVEVVSTDVLSMGTTCGLFIGLRPEPLDNFNCVNLALTAENALRLKKDLDNLFATNPHLLKFMEGQPKDE